MKISPIRLFYNTNNELLTVDFGHGGRAEHDSGIEKFKKTLAVHTEMDGLSKYSINLFPIENYIFEKFDYKGQQYFVFYFSTNIIYSNSVKRRDLKYWIVDQFNLKYSERCRNGINSAWSSSEFLVASNESYERDINSLFNAFSNMDILIGYSAEREYTRGELKLSIRSNVEILPNDYELIIDKTGINTYHESEYYITAKSYIHQKLADEGKWQDKRAFEKELKIISKRLNNMQSSS